MNRPRLEPAISAPAPPSADAASCAFFLDVDGTLIEIAPTPEAVRVGPALIGILDNLRLASGGAVALVSGRRIADLDALFHPLVLPAAGAHGLERRRADGSVETREADPALAALRPALSEFAAARPGIRCEDKRLTLALHFRLAPEREGEVHDLARRLVAGCEDQIKLIAGKMVVEFQPRLADKGRAIAAFLAEPPFAGRRAIFVGDDTTDEDGFAEIERRGGISVLVGERAPTAARWRLPSVAAVHAWLVTMARS